MPPLTNLPFQSRNLHPLAKATVLRLVAGDEITPSSRAAIEVAAALSAAGARALVACTARLKGELQAKGGIFFPLPSSSKNPLLIALSVRRLVRVIEMERADIVHVRSRALGWMAYGATRLTKTPLVTSYACGNDSRNPISARYNSVLARGDLVLAESNFAAAPPSTSRRRRKKFASSGAALTARRLRKTPSQALTARPLRKTPSHQNGLRPSGGSGKPPRMSRLC